MSKKNTRERGLGAMVFALILIFTPNINVVDILPDFIAYAIFINKIGRAADTAPYFAEAKTMFTRLLWLDILRIPAFMVISFVRQENYADTDIIVLMTLTFAVAEGVLLTLAIINVFSGAFYLGERTDTGALIGKFRAFRSSMKPEFLRNMLIAFTVVKCAANLLPEMLLLTRSVEIGSNEYVGNRSALYPPALLLCLLISTVFGVICIYATRRYISAIGSSGINSALDKIAQSSPEQAEKKREMRTLKHGMLVLTLAAFFSIEVIFDNFHDINLLPHFIYGALLTVGIYITSKHLKNTKLGKIAVPVGSLYCIFSLIAFISAVRFLSNYDYRDLLGNDTAAHGAYMPIIIFSALELAALIFLLFLGAVLNRQFVLQHTGLELSCDRYSRADRDYHRALVGRGYALYAIAAAAGGSKFINVLLKYNVQIIFTDSTDITMPAVITSSVPWFGTVVFALAVVYIVFSLLYFSTVKEEIDIKYGNH